MWEMIGTVILSVVGGIWIGARLENWYLRNRYRFTPRWGRMGVELEG
jgi:hypothetical protein